eukprot:767072-Hanusia_phi.AAC.5
MAAYLIFNVNLGLSPGSNDSAVLALRLVFLLGPVRALTSFMDCFHATDWEMQIPAMISSVYEAKIRACKKDSDQVEDD